MTYLEPAFLWLAVVAYAAATILVVSGVVFVGERLLAAGVWTAVVAFAAQTASLLVRIVASGRFPVARNYENAMAGSWAIVLVMLAVIAVRPRFRAAATIVLPLVLLTLGFGATTPMEIAPLSPAYRSGWLAIHVTFAWVTYACYMSAAGVSVLALLRGSGSRRLARLQERLPASAETEVLQTRLVALGFLMNAVMIASGSIWAYRLWGSYWSWDPVETWSLITWLAYALYLHLKVNMGWSGPRLSWLVLFALFGVMMAFWGVQLVPSSYHLFRSIGQTAQQVRP